MILRTHDDGLLAITQPDHAALANTVIAACHDLDAHPRRDAILFAAREHDNGWREEDATGHIDSTSGAPLDFIHVPAAVKHQIWPRAIARVGQSRPYEAALIAEHALTVHGHMRREPGWSGFFETLASLREAMLARGGGRDTIEADYRFVQTADRLSLIFCNAWRDAYDLPIGGGTILKGDTLEISAAGFAGVRLPFAIEARRISRGPYATAAEFTAALAAAPVVVLTGEALGTHVPHPDR
jgi:hypothetical protein